MENLVELVLSKGLTFAIAVVAVFLVGYFIKKERDDREQEFKEYKQVIKLNQTNMTEAAVSIKIASNEAIKAIKLESSAIRVQMDLMTKSMDEFQSMLAKETQGIKIHSSQIFERTENFNQSIKEVLGKVILIENKQQIHHKVLEILSKKLKS
jgi:hypothetical protein